jgi:pimeloyl-ACP methyl ester carboxylesterase
MVSRTDFGGCPFVHKVEGQGEPVVLIQGVGLHGDGWLPQTASLRSGYRCLTFDNRGMGQSQPAARPITIEQMALDTLAVMDAAGMKGAVHLVGHSMGGAIAQAIALAHPARVKSLALLCTSARGADATRLSWRLMQVGIRTRVGTRRMRRHAFLEIIMPPEYLATQDRDTMAEKLAPLVGHDLADTPPVAMKQLRALGRFDATGSLSRLAGIPTLVLSAEHDIIFPPACGRALAAGIPGSRYVEIADAGHGVPIQKADVVNEALYRVFEGKGAG